MTAVNITLEGGLCNKLFCLFSACDIAIKNKTKIIEPVFGWERKILFSEIYDIRFFNKVMKEFNDGEELIVPHASRSKYKIKQNEQDLWLYSESVLRTQRDSNQIKRDCMMIVVLSSLKLNKRNLQLCNDVPDIESKCAMHIRIEQDWVKYAKGKMKKSKPPSRGIRPRASGLAKQSSRPPSTQVKELYLINTDSLIDLYKKKGFEEDVFFTTGQNQSQVQEQMLDNNIKSSYIFIHDLEYEINAAINFELCCRAKRFIGLSRSTFSNLISLRRALLDKNNSYIYNLNHQLCMRVDKGLHPCPKRATCNKVDFV